MESPARTILNLAGEVAAGGVVDGVWADAMIVEIRVMRTDETSMLGLRKRAMNYLAEMDVGFMGNRGVGRRSWGCRRGSSG